MLRVKEEEMSMSKGRDRFQADYSLSDEYSENELELYQQYCAGKYADHVGHVHTSTPHAGVWPLECLKITPALLVSPYTGAL